jgi:hypothetical protein
MATKHIGGAIFVPVTIDDSLQLLSSSRSMWVSATSAPIRGFFSSLAMSDASSCCQGVFLKLNFAEIAFSIVC